MNLVDIIMRGSGSQPVQSGKSDRLKTPADPVLVDQITGRKSDPWADFPDAPATDPWADFPDAPEQAQGNWWEVDPHAAPAPGAAQTGALSAPSPAPMSFWDSFLQGAGKTMNVIDRGVRGAAEGIVTLGALPVDLPALAGDLLDSAAQRSRERRLAAGVETADTMGTESLAALFKPFQFAREYVGAEAAKKSLNDLNDLTADLLGVERPRQEPEGMVERMTQRVGQEVGAALLPLGPILSKAKEGVTAARELPTLARMFVEPAAVNPGKFVRKELMAAGAAGGGAGLANEAFPGSRIADLIGAIMGVGAFGAMGTVAKPISNLAAAVTGSTKFSNDVIRDVALDRILRAAGFESPKEGAPINSQPLADQINATPPVDETIPGFRESLADRTKNPGVAALEYSRQSGENAGAYTQRRVENTQAVDDALSSIEPQGTSGAMREALNNEADARIGAATVQRQNAEDAYTQAIEPLRSVMTAEGRGAEIRGALESASEAARAVLREAWAPLNRSGEQVDMAPLADRFGAVDQSLSTAERQRFRPGEAAIPASFINPDNPAGTMQSLNEITGIRSALTDAQRAAGTAGRDNEARVIGQYIEQIDGYMSEHLPPDLQQQYQQARELRRDYGDRFQRPQTAIAQTLDQQEGQYRMPASSVPGKFVQNDQGRIADFEALMRETGTDDRTRAAVRDQILSDVRERGLLENPQRLEQYLGQYNTVFERFPELRTELGNAGNLRRQFDQATAAETTTRDTLTRPGRSAVADYRQYGAENADRAIQSVLNAKEPARAADELLSFVRDDRAAVEGIRKAFWDLMQKQSRSSGNTTHDIQGVQPWLTESLARFLNDPRNAAVAERLYRDSPEHLANLRKISETLRGTDLRRTGRAPNTSGTAQGVQSVLPSSETIASRVFAVKRGVVSPAFAVVNVLGIMARRATKNHQIQAINNAIDKALLDPEFAAALAEKNNPANRAAMARKAKLWLGNEAATVVDLLGNEREDRDPVKDAVMR